MSFPAGEDGSFLGGSTSLRYIGKGTSREGIRRRRQEHRKFTRETCDGSGMPTASGRPLGTGDDLGVRPTRFRFTGV